MALAEWAQGSTAGLLEPQPTGGHGTSTGARKSAMAVVEFPGRQGTIRFKADKQTYALRAAVLASWPSFS